MCPFKSKTIARPSTNQIKASCMVKRMTLLASKLFHYRHADCRFHNCQTIIYAPD